MGQVDEIRQRDSQITKQSASFQCCPFARGGDHSLIPRHIFLDNSPLLAMVLVPRLADSRASALRVVSLKIFSHE